MEIKRIMAIALLVILFLYFGYLLVKEIKKIPVGYAEICKNLSKEGFIVQSHSGTYNETINYSRFCDYISKQNESNTEY